MSRRYLRKAVWTLIRAGGQPVTNMGAHVAQWHSLNPRPNPQGEHVDMQPALDTPCEVIE